MESMANEVIDCIGKGVYNEEPIKCFRGVGKEDNFVFRDEDELKSLSLLSEERKEEDRTTYQASTGEKLRYLENVWSVKKNFSGAPARVGQSPILMEYGQPLFVWLSRD